MTDPIDSTVDLARRRDPLPEPQHGWDHPWPTAFEVADALPTSKWTLIGGLMVQAHSMGHGIRVTRPTTDLDLLLHIEVDPVVASEAHHSLERIGYHLQEPFDRRGPHYRYLRGEGGGADKIDVMAADHAAPQARQELHGRPMFEVEGGMQALRRTMIYETRFESASYAISVPDELNALVLKCAAHIADQRDSERHLFDAVVLSACIVDPSVERDRLQGSDRKRIAHLAEHLADPRHPACLSIDADQRTVGQDALRILTAPGSRSSA